MTMARRITWDSRWGAVGYSIRQAAEAAGVSRSTIQRHLKEGRLSRSGDDKKIDPSELARLYPDSVKASPEHGQSIVSGTPRPYPNEQPVTPQISDQSEVLRAQLEAAQAMIEDRGKTIEDLRTRLDESEQERKATQTKLTALLTDQRQSVPEMAPQGRRPHWGYWLALVVTLALAGAAAAFLYAPHVLGTG